MRIQWLPILPTLLLTSCVTMVGDWGEEPRYTTYESSETLQGAKRIEASVELNVGKLEIQPGSPDKAYDLSLHYNKAAFEPRLDFRRDGDAVKLHFELAGEGKKFNQRIGKTRINLRLNPDKPLSLNARTGVGETEIDLSDMMIEQMRLESGVGETNLAMLTPNRIACREVNIRSGVGHLAIKGLGNFGFDRMVFEGGVGAAELDFTGSWDKVGEVEIRVGVGGILVELPRTIGAEIRTTKSFLSGVNLSDFRKEGDTYYSNNLDRVDKVVKIRITAGIGGVDVTWI